MTFNRKEFETMAQFITLALDKQFEDMKSIKIGVGDIARMTEKVCKLVNDAAGRTSDPGQENALIVALAKQYGLV